MVLSETYFGSTIPQYILFFIAVAVGAVLGRSLSFVYRRRAEATETEIGDIVDVEGTTGTVEEIGIRTTRLRDFDGRMVTIPSSATAKGARSRSILCVLAVAVGAVPGGSRRSSGCPARRRRRRWTTRPT